MQVAVVVAMTTATMGGFGGGAPHGGGGAAAGSLTVVSMAVVGSGGAVAALQETMDLPVSSLGREGGENHCVNVWDGSWSGGVKMVRLQSHLTDTCSYSHHGHYSHCWACPDLRTTRGVKVSWRPDRFLFNSVCHLQSSTE